MGRPVNLMTLSKIRNSTGRTVSATPVRYVVLSVISASCRYVGRPAAASTSRPKFVLGCPNTMAMHLIDRPAFAHEAVQHRTGGVTASVALHVLALAALIAIIRSVPGETVPADAGAPFISDPLVWIPSIAIGGGRSGGGDHSIAPPRRPREIGDDAV